MPAGGIVSPMVTDAFDPARVVSDLEELRALTGGPEGARRLAWTDDWVKARDLLRAKLGEIPGVAEPEMDASTLPTSPCRWPISRTP